MLRLMSWQYATNTVFMLLSFTALALSQAAPSYSCEPIGAVDVVNARLNASASKGNHMLAASQVFLYSGHKLVAKTKTDRQGHFVIDHLPPGRYQLFIEGLSELDVLSSLVGMGAFEVFDIEVKPGFSQQMHYSFMRFNGCTMVMMTTN